jgi:zinc transporter ZupT
MALGAGLVFFFKTIEKHILNLMLGFASGIMIAASFWSLLAPAIEQAEKNGGIPWLTVALGIGIQNFPEGAAVSIPLRQEGFSRTKSFLYGQASGIVEPIAGVIGALLVTQVQGILPYALAFAAGAMIFVVVEELIPEAQSNTDGESHHAVFGTMIGFTVMMILDVALG